MAIQTFAGAKDMALRWLAEHGHVEVPADDLWPVDGGDTEQTGVELDAAGWRFDPSGFFQSRYEAWIRPHWCVRYWHLDDPTAAGVLRVYEDGRVEPGYALFMGCMGLFPAGMFRIEADGTTTPVASGYSNDATDQFAGGHEPRCPGWVQQGWKARSAAG